MKGVRGWLGEMQLAELSDRGDDTGKGGLKDAVRYRVLGVGSVPLTELEKTRRGNGCGAGMQRSV